MTTYSNQIRKQSQVELGCDKGIEALQAILIREQAGRVTYEEAQEVAGELLTFFEALSDCAEGGG